MAVATATMLLATSMVVACGEEARMQDSIQQVKQRHESRLMAMEGVVSVGIGRDEADRPIIVVGLDRERPEAQAQLPGQLDGYEVRARVIGNMKAH